MLVSVRARAALTGFSTDVAGEVQMAGFEAGYMGEDGFSVAALALFAFHLGVQIPNIQAAKGGFDYPSFEQAWRLGLRMTVDLRRWDPWPHMARPLPELRAQLLTPPPP